MQKLYKISSALFATLMLTALTACGASSSTPTSTTSAKAPYLIGEIAALSGVGGESGIFKVNGAKMAVAEINKAGGINGHLLKLKVEDDRTTNPGTVAAFQKLVSLHPVAIIGPIRSTEVQAINPFVKKAGIPMFIGGTDPKLTNEGDPWTIRTRPNDVVSADVMVHFVLNKYHPQKVCIVHSTDAFGRGANTQLVYFYKKAGVNVVKDYGYANHTHNFTGVVEGIKTSGCTVIDTYMTYSGDAAAFAKLMAQDHVNIHNVSSPTFANTTFLKLAGPAAYGTYSIEDYVREQNPQAAAFYKKYEALYNVRPDIFASYVYDAVHILALAIKNAHSTNPSAVRKAILAIRNYKGTEGTYNYDSHGDAVVGYSIVHNVNGKVVFLKRVSLNHHGTGADGLTF